MDVTFSDTLRISLEASQRFARLSGDYNPLHIDPIAARRLRYGHSVVHGVHLYLCALNALVLRTSLVRVVPQSLTASFTSAALTDASVAVDLTWDGTCARVAARDGERPIFHGSISFASTSGAGGLIEDTEFLPDTSHVLTFPPPIDEGRVALRLNRALFAELFPSLATLAELGWIADVLATTHVVGMRCPGLHSIYTGFQLTRNAAPIRDHRLRYQVTGTEPRLQLVRLQVTGAYLQGTLDTAFRPGPVAQLPIKDIAAAVSGISLADQRVLIVGGSRGLGELTAKIAAAAGADVTITYARGKADADRVCMEVASIGGRCTSQALDLTQMATDCPQWLRNAHFSHIYFFATPSIARNTGPWSEGLFRQFMQFYVSAFARLVWCTRPRRDALVRYLFPSSIFVDQPEAGFREYAVAKAAGEALCHQLRSIKGAQFCVPRLPRMKTDQTAAISDVGALEPLPVMLNVVREFHAGERTAAFA